MPANVVKTGEQERLWNKAKGLAEKQGHAKDWPYIMGIFKQMGAMTKSLQVPPAFRNQSTPGQVPSKENLEIMRMATQRPKPFSVARLLANDEPRHTLASVMKGMGLSLDKVGEWVDFLGEAVRGATNEVQLRQSILAKCLEDNMDGAFRQALLQRSLSYWRGQMQKSEVEVFSVDDLRKAEPRGGTYYKRTPTKGGKYRYFYNEEEYGKAKDAHVSGKDAESAHISGKVLKAIESAGEGGCDVSAFKDLVKKYGSQKVAGILKGGAGGKAQFKKGKFYLGGSTPEKAEKKPKAIKDEPAKKNLEKGFFIMVKGEDKSASTAIGRTTRRHGRKVRN